MSGADFKADAIRLAKQAGVTSNGLSQEQLERVAGAVISNPPAIVGAVAGVMGAMVGAAGLGIAVRTEAGRHR